jgi:hypothetical protein
MKLPLKNTTSWGENILYTQHIVFTRYCYIEGSTLLRGATETHFYFLFLSHLGGYIPLRPR